MNTSEGTAAVVVELTDNLPLLAEILSYLVYNTSDVAKLRLISKHWNYNALPFLLKSAGFIRNCYPNYSFISELVKIEEFPSPSHWRDLDQNDINLPSNSVFKERGTIHFAVTMNIDPETEQVRIIDDTNFASQAKILCQTKSFSEFENVSKDALSSGMFLSIEEYEVKKTSYASRSGIGTKLGFCQIVAGIITLKLFRNECSIHRRGATPIVFFHGTGEQDLIIPFNPSGTYRGYVVEESENIITCNIPLIMGLSYDLMDDLFESHASDVLALTSLWSKTQEALLVPEGIAMADGMIPSPLHKSLVQQIDYLADCTEPDYHPHSNGTVRDLIHPSLYPLVKGVSTLIQRPIPLSVQFDQDIADRFSQLDPPSGPTDYWGRKYEVSNKYQWLPTYFDIGFDGHCSIEDYINNLVPRSNYEVLYNDLANLFSHALPLIESVVSYARAVRPRIRHTDTDDIDYNERPVDPIAEVYHPLRGKKLQVITKIVDYELKPGQTYEGVWHVEGMSHEEIIATMIYFINRDDDIVGGDILFKRAFHKQECEFIFSNIPQCRPQHLDRIIEEGLLPLGKVETLPKRLLVFPNSHVHKVTQMENLSLDTNISRAVQKRRIIAFFIVNPEKRITSTREVPPQPTDLGGNITREDAIKYRLELMNERKYTKQDWNVRHIELCEH